MTPPDEARVIAGRLTKAEADALCGRFSFQGAVEAENGEARLVALGLWACGPSACVITPLGEQVRAAIRGTPDAE